jgi:hypothetical protein
MTFESGQLASPDYAIGRSSRVLGENETFLHYVEPDAGTEQPATSSRQ